MKTNIYKIIWDLINNKCRRDIKDLSEEDFFVVKKHLLNIDKKIDNCNPDYDRMWNGIKSKTIYKRKYSINNYLRYAASVVVLFAVSTLSYYIYNNLSHFEIPKSYSTVERISNKGVQLFLPGGKKIDLSNTSKNNLIKAKSLLIKNEPNKLLSYIKKTDTVIKSEYNTIEVPKAAEYSVRLSDGTIVYLNSDSKLRYPVPFEKGVRKVYLEGEAYFKVSKDKSRPFIVDLKDVAVKVLGTSFNINAYAENNRIATTLIEGSVNVSSDNKSVIIKPNQQAVFLKNGSVEVNNVDVYNYISWRQGYLNFDNVPLEKLMIELERWFDINVFYVNNELKNYRYTGAINKYYSLDNMLHIIEEVLKIRIRIKGKNVFIEKSSV